ncbi:PP0621 family protein [Poseidonibacter sp.]|uniref:PP0621 family protein n=1 Tax=Poseidonibacter sp. TaxID=2321188 RepID=UPI003C7139E0
MIFKILAVAAVLFLVYIVFFKKNREKDNEIINEKRRAKKDQDIQDEMVECPTCKTYISKDEAILSSAKFYCSKECLNNK